jgi:ferredoxin
LAPQWFDQDDLGNGIALDVRITSSESEQAEIMVLACPEGAIALVPYDLGAL